MQEILSIQLNQNTIAMGCSILGGYRYDNSAVANVFVFLSKRNIGWNMSHCVEDTTWCKWVVKRGEKTVVAASNTTFFYADRVELKTLPSDLSDHSIQSSIKNRFLTHFQSLEFDTSVFQQHVNSHESFTGWCHETNHSTEFLAVFKDNFPPWYRIETITLPSYLLFDSIHE